MSERKKEREREREKELSDDLVRLADADAARTDPPSRLHLIAHCICMPVWILDLPRDLCSSFTLAYVGTTLHNVGVGGGDGDYGLSILQT